MNATIAWLNFKFEPPAAISEAQYAEARDRPDALRRSVRARLRAAAGEAAPPTIGFATLAAACFGAAAWCDLANPRSWQSAVGKALLISGLLMSVSALLTAGSFLYYATAVTRYWRSVARVARDARTHPDFLAAWTRQQQRPPAGINRKLPWWLSWLLLAAVLAAAYYGLARHFGE